MDRWPRDSSGMTADDGFLLHDTSIRHAREAQTLKPHPALASKQLSQRTAPKLGAAQQPMRGQTPFSFSSDAAPNSDSMEITPPFLMEQLPGTQSVSTVTSQQQQQEADEDLLLDNMSAKVCTKGFYAGGMHRALSSQSPGPAYGQSPRSYQPVASPHAPGTIGTHEPGIAQDQQSLYTEALHSSGQHAVGRVSSTSMLPTLVPPSPGASQDQADSWNLFARRIRTGSLQRLASAKLRPTLSQVESVGRMSWEEHTSVMDEVAPLGDVSDTLLLYDMWGSTPASPCSRPPSSSQLLMRSTLNSTLPKPRLGDLLPSGSLPHISSSSPYITAGQDDFRESYSGSYGGPIQRHPLVSPHRNGYQSLRSPISARTTWSPATGSSSVLPPGSGSGAAMARSGSVGLPQGQRGPQVLTVRPWYGSGAPFNSTGELTDTAGDGATYSAGHLLSSPMHRLLSLDTGDAPHSANAVGSNVAEWRDSLLQGMKPSGSEGALDLLLQDETRELYHQAHSRHSMEQHSGDGREGMSSGTDVVSLLEEAESAHRVALGAALDPGPQSVGTLLLRPSHEVQQATFQQAASQREQRGINEWMSKAGLDGEVLGSGMPGDAAVSAAGPIAAAGSVRPASAMASPMTGRPRHLLPLRSTYHGQSYQDMAPAGTGGHAVISIPRRGISGEAGRYGDGSPRAGLTMAGVHSPVKLNRRGGMFSRMRHVCSTPALDILVESQQEGLGALTEPSHISEHPKEGARMPSVADMPDEEHVGAGPGIGEVEGMERPVSSHGAAHSCSNTSVATTIGSTVGSAHTHSHTQHGLNNFLPAAGKSSFANLLYGRMSTPGRIEGMQRFSVGTWEEEDGAGSEEGEMEMEGGAGSSLAEMLAAVGEVRSQRQLTLPPARSPFTTRLSHEVVPLDK